MIINNENRDNTNNKPKEIKGHKLEATWQIGEKGTNIY